MQNKISLKLTLFCLLIALQVIVRAEHVCQHDTQIDFSIVNKQIDETRRLSEQKQHEKNNLRVLQANFPQQIRPIRVTMDYSLFPQMTKQITEEQKQYLIKIMENVKVYFEKLLKVIPATSANKFLYQKCYEADIPNKYRVDGEKNTDLHIWVIYDNEQNTPVLANAIHCQMDDTLKRPNFGRVKVNMGRVGKSNTAGSFESDLNTILHECLHIMGFSQSLYKYWVDPDTGNYYLDNQSKILKTIQIRGKNTYILSSKNILETARKYYGCPTLEGMQLENDGTLGSMGSHWEKTILYNELMAAESSGNECQLSIFTIALLKDTGFYAEVNENIADDIQWGRNRGCDFVINACNSETKYPEFSTLDLFGQCSLKADGYGGLSGSSFADNCKLINNYVKCANLLDKKDNSDQRLETFGNQSKCFESTASDGTEQYDQLFEVNSRCHQVQCNADATIITITIPQLKNKQLICNLANQGKEIQVQPGRQEYGTISCPDNYKEFCRFTSECPNYCSQKGICILGQCKCNQGWTGSDCSVSDRKCPYYLLEDEQTCVQNCPQGKYANPDKICRGNCPRGYYQGKNQCLECDLSCSFCSGPSKNECLQCQFLTYLENNKCVKQCSAGFQLVDRQCIPSMNQGCDSNCEICDKQNKQQCNICNSQTFLNLQTRKCVLQNQCPNGTYANQVNRTCSDCEITGCSQCQSQTTCAVCDSQLGFSKKGNLCIQCPLTCEKCQNDQCTVCKKGYYLSNGNCVSRCPDQTLQNKDNGKCEKCSLEGCLICYDLKSCSTCDENSQYYLEYQNYTCVKKGCTAPCATCVQSNSSICTSCAGSKYLIDSRCVDSCPYGLFGDYQTKKCTKCAEGCKSCYDLKNCIECDQSQGYYKEGDVCRNSSKCNFPCKNCLADNKSVCTECIDGFLVYQNKCYQNQCPEGTYNKDGKQCMKCPVGCKTCYSQERCITCEIGFGTYRDNTNNLLICQKCMQGCLSCDDIQRCNQCDTKNRWNINREYKCVKQGDSGNSGSSGNTGGNSKNCNPRCKTCDQNNNQICSSCDYPRFLLKGECVDNCPHGTFYNMVQFTCEQCRMEGCFSCSSNEKCHVCQEGYSLQGSYQEGGKCVNGRKLI